MTNAYHSFFFNHYHQRMIEFSKRRWRGIRFSLWDQMVCVVIKICFTPIRCLTYNKEIWSYVSLFLLSKWFNFIRQSANKFGFYSRWNWTSYIKRETYLKIVSKWGRHNIEQIPSKGNLQGSKINLYGCHAYLYFHWWNFLSSP